MGAKTTSLDIAASVPEELRPLVAGLAENALFMRRKLAEARVALEGQDLVIEYDNGGGQRGTRRNPAFDAYNALLRSYNATVRSIRDILASSGADAGAGRGGLDEMRRGSPTLRAV